MRRRTERRAMQFLAALWVPEPGRRERLIQEAIDKGHSRERAEWAYDKSMRQVRGELTWRDRLDRGPA